MDNKKLTDAFVLINDGIASATAKNKKPHDIAVAHVAKKMLGRDTVQEETMPEWGIMPDTAQWLALSSGACEEKLKQLSTNDDVVAALRILKVDLLARHPEALKIPMLKLSQDYDSYLALVEPQGKPLAESATNDFNLAKQVLECPEQLKRIQGRFPDTMTDERIDRAKIALCVEPAYA